MCAYDEWIRNIVPPLLPFAPVLLLAMYKVGRFSLCTEKRRLLICKWNVFTYVRKPVHKGENWLNKWLLTLPGHNFVNNGPILTILVPINSQG